MPNSKSAAALAALFASLVFSTPVSGQVVRTWVSTAGTNNPACTRSAPCRTFDAAIAAVDAGGEVVVLDSGGYGSFTVDKSVTVVAPVGIHAAIAPTSGNAVTVAAGLADSVRLINLQLIGRGAEFGILFTSGADLTIDGCAVHGFTNWNVLLAASARTTVSRSVLSGGRGIWIGTGQAQAGVTVERTRIEDGANGIVAQEDSRVVVTDSVLSGNANGLMVHPPAWVMLERTLVAFGTNGIWVGNGGATLTLSGSTVTQHSNNGVLIGGGSGTIAYSRGNNTILGNISNVIGTLVAVAGQ